MTQIHGFETRERSDEWGNCLIDVVLADVVMFIYATGYPPPADRLMLQSVHDTAIRIFARRLSEAVLRS